MINASYFEWIQKSRYDSDLLMLIEAGEQFYVFETRKAQGNDC